MESINKISIVIEYMKQHIYEDLSLEDLCSVSGYSKSHLCYSFKLYIGDTPLKYFYKLKLKKGANLLFENDNILNISLIIGFGSHEAFSRAFKKEFGMSPIEYRDLFHNGVYKLSDLNDIELLIIFTESPAYRKSLGYDLFGKYYDVYQSLIEKGYIDEQNLDFNIDGKQLCDKYYWDCCKIIIELSKFHNTLSELFEVTNKIISIPKLLLYKFVIELIDSGKIKNDWLKKDICDNNKLKFLPI